MLLGHSGGFAFACSRLTLLLNMLGDQEAPLSASRTSQMDQSLESRFASAPTRSGRRTAACTAKPLSIGLWPSGKSWRHRQFSPANPLRKKSAECLHVREPPRRSRGPARIPHIHHWEGKSSLHGHHAAAGAGMVSVVHGHGRRPGERRSRSPSRCDNKIGKKKRG